jgi:hypothetical protein
MTRQGIKFERSAAVFSAARFSSAAVHPDELGQKKLLTLAIARQRAAAAMVLWRKAADA